MTKQEEQLQITLGREELKSLIQDAVREALAEMFGQDLNAEPRFAPEIVERLMKYRSEKPNSVSIDEAAKVLGLDA